MKIFKTIILSDLHLGSGFENLNKLKYIFNNYKCDELILNGDIFDIWKLNYSKKSINKDHYEIISKILDNNNFNKIFYICGNHDDLIRHFIPFSVKNIVFSNYYKFKDIKGNACYAVHGDKFDYFSSELDYIAKISDILYQKLFINILSKSKAEKIINLTKLFVSSFNKIDDKIIKFAKDEKIDIIFCGHTHMPKILIEDNIMYINSGDFVESNTIITQDYKGNWNLIKI